MAKRPHQQICPFARPTESGHYGRNGVMQGHGIIVEAWGGEAHLTALVSKGRRSGAARLSVPFTALDDVIDALIAVRDGTA
ncbi:MULTISPECIES: hypothetical protein [unclassified Methylobacterium]|uniref:hypothetical protein n=1 Tax=unclassified Methylobacterium TaxID=2615210 RepID=UPI0011C1D5AF|nr:MULTISPECIES: hypothetical protein [unclassified Methylobacterium]QEE37981.1 hypothetical protein FVA80_02350 [Methylobacterium sp. WL1]TXN59821.1 hypothetical protein FV241_00180 [Methylobacterium sp. WL2]